MAKFSVAICCADVADTLEAACRSVAWADELVIVDSGSTDATPAIAHRFAQRYVVEPWRGYTAQKAFATTLCRNDWVVVLDGDEECSPELGRELAALPEGALERWDVLLVPRRHYVMGRRVLEWPPDWQSRVIHRGRCRWADEALHDARLPSDPSRVRKLRGALLHKRTSAAGFRDYFNGRLLDERLLLVARDLYAKGRRARLLDLALRPFGAFLKFYVLKLGFLDGAFGLLVARRAYIGTQLKYAALWAVEHGLDRPQEDGS